MGSNIEGIKCLKWTLRVTNRFVTRYTSKTHVDSSNPVKCNLYNIFITGGAVSNACQSVISLIKQHYSSKIFLPSSILYSAITFLKRCLQMGMVYKNVIKPHNEELALIMYNTLKLNAADEQMLEDDRREFIECQMNECYNYLTPRQAVSEFITYSTKYRGSDFMSIYIMLLGRYLPSKDVAEKFGSMSLLGLLSDRLTSKKRMNDFNLFNTLSTHVMPEFGSDSMWLQIKACWVYSIYVTVADKWAVNRDQHLTQVYKFIFEKCMDSNFVIKAIAVGCVKEFFNVNSEHLQSVITATVAQLVPIIFEIMAELEIETVASTLNDMIDKYKDHVTPHSAEIAAHLVSTLKVLLLEKDDETGDFSLTALTLLQTLTTLCDSLVDRKETLDDTKCDIEGMIMNHIVPLISYIFDKKCVDYYDENIVLLSLIIKLTRQPGIFYSYMDKILQAVSSQNDADDASDMGFLYVEQMIQSSLMAIKLLFQRDPQTFCNNIHYQQSLMAIVDRATIDQDVSQEYVITLIISMKN